MCILGGGGGPVRTGILHGIPDLDTFIALGLDLEKDVVVLDDSEMDLYYVGESLPHRES